MKLNARLSKAGCQNYMAWKDELCIFVYFINFDIYSQTAKDYQIIKGKSLLVFTNTIGTIRKTHKIENILSTNLILYII